MQIITTIIIQNEEIMMVSTTTNTLIELVWVMVHTTNRISLGMKTDPSRANQKIDVNCQQVLQLQMMDYMFMILILIHQLK